MLLASNNIKKFINAKVIKLGTNVDIGKSTLITGVNGPAEYVEIGDNTYIDRNVFIMTPKFIMGDYGKIYKNCRISGYKDCIIGHNFWMDQNCILNCTDELNIGNNVGVGAYSQLWTHIKHGDVLEGCRFNSTKAMTIEDDVWFVGHCIVSPVLAEKKSMALVGSVITKDMKENHIYGGSPAIDLTEKMGNQFIERSVDEKFNMLIAKLNEFDYSNPGAKDRIKIVTNFDFNLNKKLTYFNVTTRTYTKRQSKAEIDFIKFLLPFAKFTPHF